MPLDVQEVDKSSAVVSYTPPNPEVRVFISPHQECIRTNKRGEEHVALCNVDWAELMNGTKSNGSK